MKLCAHSKFYGQHPSIIERPSKPEPPGERDVVVAMGPAFATALDTTLCGLRHGQVLKVLTEGIESKGMRAFIFKIFHTAECGMLGFEGAKISGSGIAIGQQSKGTAVIQRKAPAPFNNLELFSQAPLLDTQLWPNINAG